MLNAFVLLFPFLILLLSRVFCNRNKSLFLQNVGQLGHLRIRGGLQEGFVVLRQDGDGVAERLDGLQHVLLVRVEPRLPKVLPLLSI